MVTEEQLRRKWAYNEALADKWLLRTGFFALPAALIFTFVNFDSGLELPSGYLMWTNLLFVALGMGIIFSLLEALQFKGRAWSARNHLRGRPDRELVKSVEPVGLTFPRVGDEHDARAGGERPSPAEATAGRTALQVASVAALVAVAVYAIRRQR